MSDSPKATIKQPGATKTAVRRPALPAGALYEEPFRVLFPLGILIGISGVSLWPLFFSGLHKFYPGVMHARMMIEGFMGCFVLGFLGTALPRLTDTSRLSRIELWSMVLLMLAAMGLHIGHQHAFGDGAFLGLLLIFAARMGWRLSRSEDLPPPSFALVAFGVFSAIAGTALLLAGACGLQDLRWSLLGLLMLYQGFVLSLVLGVGGFLLPRFFGIPPKSSAEAGPEFSSIWKRRAAFAGTIGALLLASFVVEAFTSAPRVAGVMRFLAAGAFLASEVGVLRGTKPGATVTRLLRIALIFVLLGLLFPLLWSMQRVAGLHLLFIGGFTLITLTVATRVVMGHSGQGHLVSQPLPFLRNAATLLVIAAILRVMGDFDLAVRGRLLDLASYAWMLAATIWSWRLLPRVRYPDEEEMA